MSVYKSITKGLKEAIEYEKGAVNARTAKARVVSWVKFDKTELPAKYKIMERRGISTQNSKKPSRSTL